MTDDAPEEQSDLHPMRKSQIDYRPQENTNQETEK